MDFFKQLEDILQIQIPSQKCKAFKTFYKDYTEGSLTFNYQHKAKVFTEASYTGFCTLVSSTTGAKRKKLSTPRGKVVFLHAIAHIEYSAIDLAIDAAYRFKDLPKQYYDDFLSIAYDEVRHFEMLEELLKGLDSYYGDLPVHDGLFEASMKTLDFTERMALVPRYLEANGLDVTPMMIDKFLQLEDDTYALKIIDVLKIILHEECDHVHKGDIWFKYACDQDNLDYDIYFEIVEKHYPGSFPRKKEINVKARQEAGFSCSELKRMNTDIQCS
ncbi:MAG TPA: ferritin-like domain-containing protein [Sulfurimonas sp.]|nr:ferritin-like domain-containing protein [Sulfurimonas sp.]